MQPANGIPAFLTTDSPVYENDLEYFVRLIEKTGIGMIALPLKSPLVQALQCRWLLVCCGRVL